jgi:D-sedoheptulose 7-phosphate isomerase
MLGIELDADTYLGRLRDEIGRIDRSAMERWADLVFGAWEEKKFVFIIGNGGSGLTASHMCEDFGKGTLNERDFHDESMKRLKVLSLTDNAGWIMAVGNDLAYDQIFVQQLMNYGSPGDVLIAISGSGNSPNVLKAVDWANRHGLVTFGLTGYDGGRLKAMQSDGLHVQLDDMGMVESIHLCLYHWVLNDVYARIHSEGRYAQEARIE